MSGHTAGPWQLITGAHSPLVQRGRAGGFAVKGDDPNVELADARLIAAAPDMLAALKAASEIIGAIPSGKLGTQEPAYKALVIIDAAIAKAQS